ncbi:MAG: CheR family methyltransferase [Promethearchaeota archaeon]
MQNSYKKFTVDLESNEGLEELIRFLRQKKEDYILQDEDNIKKNLKFIRRKMGFTNYSSMLNHARNNQEICENILSCLNNKNYYINQPYTPSRKRKKRLQEYTRNIKPKKKTKTKQRKFDTSKIQEFLFEIKEPDDPQFLPSIMKFLSTKNINYQAYKKNYFLRRLQIRIKRAKLQSYRDYLKYLEKNPEELNLLVDCLSVNVTRFFRDKELFYKLEQDIFPSLLQKDSKSVRIWSAGCAVGPEPYSIAIVISKFFKETINENVHILATDISQELLKKAKQGRYTKDYLCEMDSLEIQTFFKSIDKGIFELSPEIRQTVTFKKHDLRSPPPAKNFDLIMCRNVLIYFSRSQSISLFQRFHSILKSHGYLVLGKCELLPPKVRKKFEIIDAHNRIYIRRD